MVNNIPAKFNAASTASPAVQPQAAPQEEKPEEKQTTEETAKLVLEDVTGKNILESENSLIPAPKPVRTKGIKKAKLMVGDHALPVRGSSGYRVLCAFLAEHGKFEEIGKLIQQTDVNDKAAASSLIDAMLIPMATVEVEMRKRDDWIKHCEYKMQQIQAKAAQGNQRAIETLNNPVRVQDGKWIGNIREMICSSIGSSSEKAVNRNTKKFKKAGLALIQFPRRPRKGQPFSVALIAADDLPKVTQAFQTVYGGFKLKPTST